MSGNGCRDGATLAIRIGTDPERIVTLGMKHRGDRLQIPIWFENYNIIHPHSGLRIREPRKVIVQEAATQPRVRSDGVHSSRVILTA